MSHLKKGYFGWNEQISCWPKHNRLFQETVTSVVTHLLRRPIFTWLQIIKRFHSCREYSYDNNFFIWLRKGRIERLCFVLIFLVQKWKQRCENDLKISSKNENSETCSEKTTDNSDLFFSGLLWSHFPKKFNLEGFFCQAKKIKQLSSDCWEIKIVRRKKIKKLEETFEEIFFRISTAIIFFESYGEQWNENM